MPDTDDDILKEARERFAEAEDAWSETKTGALDDQKFALLGEQWPSDIKRRREIAGRPCMTINRMPSFIRQVVNDGRQNRPAIKVRPVDSNADIHTADIMSGLVRHIEQISDADVAYDTALGHEASGGFGFVEIDVDYSCDDSFDKEIYINQVSNPNAVSWDPYTEAYDSSDWDFAFLSWTMSKAKFERLYPDYESSAASSEFAADSSLSAWFSDNSIQISKYWSKEEKPRKIVLLSDGSVIDLDVYTKQKAIFDEALLTVQRERETKSYEIVRRLVSGKDIIDTQRWRGSIIPLVPFYGDAFAIDGKRYLHSLIHDAKDSQRIFNFERSTATELSSLAPKVPFIGRKGSFDADAEKWSNVNSENYPYIEYSGDTPPQRQPFSGAPEGNLQQALLASEDMKTIIGIGNPSMGMPDNRLISGKAKMMERSESDVGTYHYHDNQKRGIRGVGRVVLELIPQIYTAQRIIRIIGTDGKPQSVPLGKPVPMKDGTTRIYDLAAGKYDLAVEAGPSYATQREEATDALSTIISANPPAAAILGPQLVKMYDMPDSDKVTAMLATMMPPAARAVFDGTPPPAPQPPPEVIAAQQKAQADMALSHQKATQDFQLEQQKAQSQQEREMIQAQADITVMNKKADAEIAIEQRKAELKFSLMQREAELSAALKVTDAAHAAAQPVAVQ